MSDFPILVQLGLAVSGAAATVLATRPLGVPPIVAYILAGIVLGPATGLLEVGGSVELLSHLGVALLLFVVGLELSLERVRDVGSVASVAGLLQVVATSVLGGGVALLLGFRGGDAVLIGLVTAFSSTVVVVKLLDRAGALSSRHGRLAVGVLLVQDLVVAAVLTVIAGLAGGGEGGPSPSPGGGLLRAVAGIVSMAVVAWTGVRFVLPRFLAWLAASGESLFVVGLTWCFGFILLAESFHVSIELGAFIAGISLAQLPYGRELERRVHPLASLFLAVFFVSLGGSLEVGALPSVWPGALALSLFVLVGKPAIVALLLRRSTGPREAFLAGLTLGQVSEFGFILVASAASAGLVGDPRLGPLVGLTGILTIGASAALVPSGPGLWRRMRRRDGDEPSAHAGPEPGGHVVVVGMNSLGRDLVRRFADRGDRVVAADTDPAKLEGLPARTVYGNVDRPSVLEEAGVPWAKLVVSALQIEDVNALLAYRCRSLGVPVSVHAFDPSLAEELMEIGADHLMVSKIDGVARVEAELRQRGFLL